MFYYKIEENGEVASVEARSSVSADEKMQQISEDEYITLRNMLAAQYSAVSGEESDYV